MSHVPTCTVICFSPTRTTYKILQAVAKGMGTQIDKSVDLTRPENRDNLSDLSFDGPVLLGAPVYAGRLPEDAAACFKQLQGKNTPAVVVVVYGNREYEDALLELKEIVREQDFIPMAGAAFIGEHSFSTEEHPIAPGRPDETDLNLAAEFGRKAAALIEAADVKTTDMEIGKGAFLDVPGNFPYKEGMAAKGVPFIRVTDACTGCGTCVEACPKSAIDETMSYATIPARCIFCCACIKACPEQARQMTQGPFMEKTLWLNENCSRRKEPEFFFAGR